MISKMNQQLSWYLLLSSLLCTLQATSDDAITCLPEENTCSQCYAALVQQVTTNDRNQFEVQMTFFPPDKTPPSFVTIFYEYYEDGELLPIKRDVWFWSTSTFYLYHPLHVFQFTSLLFSDLSKRTATITLKLDAECVNASDDHMRLFTQRLKIHATEKTISSPISDDYTPKVETAGTIKTWQDNNRDSSNYISSTFYVFPFLTIPILLFAVTYFNEFAKHNRMKKIKSVFESNDEKKIRSHKYQLQNEFVMSQIFVLYTFILATFGVGYTVNTGEHLNNEVTEYFNLYNGTVRSRHFTSVSILALVLDIIIWIPLQIHVAVFFYIFVPKKERQIENMWMWRYCAYSIVFPLCCAANHLNYIIIAFIHDVYHATGVAIIYGIIIFFLYAVLRQLSYILEKFETESTGELVEHTRCISLPQKITDHFFTCQLIIKFTFVILLIGYLLYDILLYYVLPINKGFDDATNHLLSLYQTTAVFFAAIAAYFFFNRPFRSPISILTKAEKGQKVFELNQDPQWETMTADQRDLLMAGKILEVLKHMEELQLPPAPAQP